VFKLDIVGLEPLKLTEDKIQHNLSQGTLSNNPSKQPYTEFIRGGHHHETKEGGNIAIQNFTTITTQTLESKQYI